MWSMVVLVGSLLAVMLGLAVWTRFAPQPGRSGTGMTMRAIPAHTEEELQFNYSLKMYLPE